MRPQRHAWPDTPTCASVASYAHPLQSRDGRAGNLPRMVSFSPHENTAPQEWNCVRCPRKQSGTRRDALPSKRGGEVTDHHANRLATRTITVGSDERAMQQSDSHQDDRMSSHILAQQTAMAIPIDSPTGRAVPSQFKATDHLPSSQALNLLPEPSNEEVSWLPIN